MAIVPARWLRRKVFQVCDGGRRGRRGGLGMYFATASLLTSWPSFASSFAIRRRLHSGFSPAIRTMSSTISGASGGRPMRLDIDAQKRAKPRRCHAITVAGFTIASASGHRDHTRETTTQKARSIARRGVRGLSRLNTASCCRRTRISTTRLARERTVAISAPSRAETIASIPGNGDANRGARHERIAAADRVESAASRWFFSHHRVVVGPPANASLLAPPSRMVVLPHDALQPPQGRLPRACARRGRECYETGWHWSQRSRRRRPGALGWQRSKSSERFAGTVEL